MGGDNRQAEASATEYTYFEVHLVHLVDRVLKIGWPVELTTETYSAILRVAQLVLGDVCVYGSIDKLRWRARML